MDQPERAGERQMDETLPGGAEPATVTAGERLRAARVQAGLTLADVAARTRIPLRQLESVEEGRYAALPSSTYAVGFAKAYARAVGADEVGIAAAVRSEIAMVGPRQAEYEPYELPDPARVPSRGLAVLGAGGALAILIVLALWYGTDLFRGRSPAPAVAPSPIATTATVARPVPAAVPVGGQVRLVANDEVWLRVYDADNKTLFLGTMKPGDHFDVPADARRPMINVGRPDKLAVTLGGRPVAPLGDGSHAIKDVRVDAASLAGHVTGAASATPTSTPTPAPSPSATAAVGGSRATREHRDRPQATATRRPVMSETQRANLDAAASPPAATGNSAP